MKTAAFFQRLNYVLGLDTPGPGFVGLLRERARRSPARGFQRFGPPLGAAPKPTAPPGLLHGEAGQSTTPPGLLHGEVRKPTTTVAFARAGFFGRAAGRNGALPYNARKSQFLRNGDVWATESLFLFAVLWLAFLPGKSETGVAGGGKARRPKPRPPRGGPPNDRDRLPVFAPPARTPDPATPPQSACSRRLSGCPQRPNLSARRRAESPKGKGKEEPRMKRAPPL